MIGQTRQLRPAQAPSFTSVNIPGCKQVAARDHYLQGPEREQEWKQRGTPQLPAWKNVKAYVDASSQYLKFFIKDWNSRGLSLLSQEGS